MCGELVSCAEFRAILTPFSEVIRKPLLLLLKNILLELSFLANQKARNAIFGAENLLIAVIVQM